MLVELLIFELFTTFSQSKAKRGRKSQVSVFDRVEDDSTGASSCLVIDSTSRPPVAEHGMRKRSDWQRVLIRNPLRSQLREDIMFLNALSAACDVHYCF